MSIPGFPPVTEQVTGVPTTTGVGVHDNDGGVGAA
jgi:hypothetical protein